MSGSDWWAKKLAQVQQPQSPQQPQRSPFPKDLLPRGISGDTRRATEHYMNREYPPQTEESGYDGAEPENISQALIHGQVKKRLASMTDTTCPNCGGSNYITPAGGGQFTQNGQIPPKAHCFDCGYPTEQGELDAATIRTPGVSQARQGDTAGSWGRTPTGD